MNPQRSLPERRRDEGSVLPLVLVMMVISAMIVVPMLAYAVTVLRANEVVADSARERESAEAALRVALLDPTGLFSLCDDGIAAVPAPDIIDQGDQPEPTATCEEIDEIGPLNAIGFQTPIGLTATQLGSSVPAGVSGGQSPSFPETDDWWSITTPVETTDLIWLPDLPQRPLTARTVSYTMPNSFDCTVYLPGYYPNTVEIATGHVYFASGVYYFEEEVKISGDADVVIGYGLAGFDHSECADDFQVGANLVENPGTFDIDGNGATFVFGKNGRLVVDNAGASGTGPSVRFNQRYEHRDGGGRISIMSVNGDDVDEAPLEVDGVVAVPRSLVKVDANTSSPIDADYVPSGPRFTPKARAPFPPTGLVATAALTQAGPPLDGAVLLTWDEITGQSAGGALIERYDVRWTTTSPNAGPTPVCDPEDVVAAAPGKLACMITGLHRGRTYTFEVTATNGAGLTSSPASSSAKPEGTSIAVDAPGSPTPITWAPYNDAALVEWAAPASDGGAPITSYTVQAQRVYEFTPAPVDPPLPPEIRYEVVSDPCIARVVQWQPAPTSCVVAELPDLASVPTDDGNGNTIVNLGYQFVVTATNAVGVSTETVLRPAPDVLALDGADEPTPADPPARILEPWEPEPIVLIDVSGDAASQVSIPGYVSVPMGRIEIHNPKGHDIKVNGGVLSSTIEVVDDRVNGPELLPIGYRNDVVLQRTIRLVATAGSSKVSATVQINENGDYGVNSWVVG